MAQTPMAHLLTRGCILELLAGNADFQVLRNGVKAAIGTAEVVTYIQDGRPGHGPPFAVKAVPSSIETCKEFLVTVRIRYDCTLIDGTSERPAIWLTPLDEILTRGGPQGRSRIYVGEDGLIHSTYNSHGIILDADFDFREAIGGLWGIHVTWLGRGPPEQFEVCIRLKLSEL